jgi:hypothetical protein
MDADFTDGDGTVMVFEAGDSPMKDLPAEVSPAGASTVAASTAVEAATVGADNWRECFALKFGRLAAKVPAVFLF